MWLKLLLAPVLLLADVTEIDPNLPLTTWVQEQMTRLDPKTPWVDTYPNSARVLAKVATEEPLFAGSNGARKTAALFLSVGWYESHFNPKAKGDCTKKDGGGKCLVYDSFCMFQIGKSNFKDLGVTEESILGDIEVCTKIARKMMKISFNICRGKAQEDWLANYTGGMGVCGVTQDAIDKGRHRMIKAKMLFDKFPMKEQS